MTVDQVPALHELHELDPADAYIPIWHTVHEANEVALEEAENVPALQFVQIEEAAVDHDPALHAMHETLADPAILVYVPALQPVQDVAAKGAQ